MLVAQSSLGILEGFKLCVDFRTVRGTATLLGVVIADTVKVNPGKVLKPAQVEYRIHTDRLSVNNTAIIISVDDKGFRSGTFTACYPGAGQNKQEQTGENFSSFHIQNSFSCFRRLR